MNDNDVKCNYHLKNISKFTCEACNNPICEDCYIIEKKEKGSGNSKEIVRHYLCKPCYYDKELVKIKSSPKHLFRKILKFIVYPILILATLLFPFIMFNPGSPSPFNLLVNLWFFFIFVIIETSIITSILKTKLNTPKMIKRLNVLKAQFFSNIKTLSKMHNAKYDNLTYKCPYCNAQIDLEIIICNFCGRDINNKTS